MVMLTHLDTDRARYTGRRGWLLFLGLGLVANALKSTNGLVTEYTDPTTQAAFAKIPVAMSGVATIEFAGFGLLLATIAAYGMRSPTFKWLFSITWAAGMLVLPLAAVWVSLTTNLSLTATLALYSPGEWGGVIGGSMVGIPWLIYVHSSQRVRNTFA